jgi:hypothetical protein
MHQPCAYLFRFLPGVDPYKLGQVGDELADLDKVRKGG